MNSNNNNTNNLHHHPGGGDAGQNENENHLIGNILAEEDEYNSGKYLALQRYSYGRLNSIFSVKMFITRYYRIRHRGK